MSPVRRRLSMVKGEHRYVFQYVEGREAELLGSFVAAANDPECEFDWFDAAVLSYQMGQQLARECEAVIPMEQG